ncbi:MAG TPA: ABC transporter ATP-binding protein [Pilimelia sp.]|nr:ABC transporter ATP-binding protein [Pilimelia sp.]
MGPVVTAHQVSKRFGEVVALDEVSFSLRENVIYGLLGRNGAGKTTLMQILTGHRLASSGRVEVFGEQPYERERVLARVCFVREGQRYPDGFRVRHALRAAELLFPRWDADFARSLVDTFDLPLRRPVKKLSRGMLSALGVVIGLASRAPLTLFDEPYLGLDAPSRQAFYDRLLADYAAHPRTVLLSTHLIDEVGDLVEHVLLVDRGRLVLDEDADTLRGYAVALSGPLEAVNALAAGRSELYRERVGGLSRVTVRGPFDDAAHHRARDLGVRVESVSLQQLVVRLTAARSAGAAGWGTGPGGPAGSGPPPGSGPGGVGGAAGAGAADAAGAVPR